MKALKKIVFVLIFTALTVSSAFADDGVISKSMYVLPKTVVDQLLNLKVYRGYGMDRQDLGIYMPAGSSFQIKLKQNVTLSLELLNNDSATEKNSLNKNSYSVGNDWVTIEADTNCVPFFKTFHSDSYETIEYEIKDLDGTQDLTIYRRGDNESDFYTTWNNNNHSYSVITDDYITFLIPIEDKEKIKAIIDNNSSATYPFTSITDMLDWYDGVITRFNNYIGLSTTSSVYYNKNIKMKFFMKANIEPKNRPEETRSNCALAYYPGNYIYTCSTSIDGLLQKGWGAVHELGHGFQSKYTWSPSDDDIILSEVENNFFAYEEEKKYSNNADGSIGILYGTSNNNVLNDQKYYMNIINNVSKFNDLVVNGAADNAGTRLFVFENLFDKIDMTVVMPYTLKKYRYIISTGGSITNSDLFGMYFSEVSNYNVIPYFNSVKIFPSSLVEKEVYNNKQPIVYSIASIVNETVATHIANEKGLRGPYSVVTNNDVKNYVNVNNIRRNIKFNITTDDENKLLHKKLYIKNSSNDIVKEVVLDSNQVTVENVPVGMYYVDIANGTVDNLNYLLVSQQDSLLITTNINYTSIEENSNVSTGSNEQNANSNQTNNNNNSNSTIQSNSDDNLTQTNKRDNSDNEEAIVVNLNYEYDPKNVNDKGEIIEAPDTGKSSVIYVAIGMIFVSFGIGIFVLKKREIFK